MDTKNLAIQSVDVFVVGGGINGVGIACDAAGRGLDVALCEMKDLASATSSSSSKLIHGGLRYLEYYEFALVRKALAEREVLLKNAPHIISPLIFRLPHRPHLRPQWMIRSGLFLYDNLSKRVSLPKSRKIQFTEKDGLNNAIKAGFEYADGWVDDARLTVLNAVAAQENGAKIYTQTKLVNAQAKDGQWLLTLEDQTTNQTFNVHSKVLVNAAGPWVESINDIGNIKNASQSVRLVKGSHIVVPKIHDLPEAYILQNEDGRIVFVIPYQQEFSLIGTTDVEFQGDPHQAEISAEETQYLVDVVNEHFQKQISTTDVVHSYAGVRPLLQDEAENPQAVTRDYTLELVNNADSAPLLNIYGGKITTYRKLSEAAVNKLKKVFSNLAPTWTKQAALPGGDFDNKETLSTEFNQEFPWLSNTLRQRLVTNYGTRARVFLSPCKSLNDMGEHFGHEFYLSELEYLIEHEFARTLEDVIWRRTKLGLWMSTEQKEKLSKAIVKINQQNL